MLSLTFLLPISIISYFHPAPTNTTIDLNDAIRQGMVIATPISTGTYGRESVTLQITNKLSRNLHIFVPSGTVYHPESSDDQSLLQIEEMNVIVSGGGKAQLPIHAYCMESSDGVPEGGTTFKIDKTVDPDLLALIKHLKTTSTDQEAYQSAVWTLTDRHELTYLPNQKPEDQALREFLSERTGLENKWYELTPERRIDPDRRIIIAPTIITGKLEFNCNPGKEIIEEVRKKDGTLILANNTNFAPRSSHLKYEFKLTIKGWEKGEYYVLVKNGVKDLARYDFAL